MARGDSIFAKTEVDWPEDPRAKYLSPSENWLYQVCRLSAVKVRLNCLPIAYGVSYLCQRAGVRRRVMASLLRKSLEVAPRDPIIFMLPDGRIAIPNTGKRHSKLRWNDEPEGPYLSGYPHTGPNGADSVFGKGGRDKEEEDESAARGPASAGRAADKEDGENSTRPAPGSSRAGRADDNGRVARDEPRPIQESLGEVMDDLGRPACQS